MQWLAKSVAAPAVLVVIVAAVARVRALIATRKSKGVARFPPSFIACTQNANILQAKTLVADAVVQRAAALRTMRRRQNKQ